MKIRKPIFERQGAQFIDPDNCGSTVQWIVQYTHSRRRFVDIDLRDCNKAIKWSTDRDDCVKNARRKIGNAIDQLKACLAAVEEMERLHPRRPQRAKKKT